jgi:methionyl-tRNA synthetase
MSAGDNKFYLTTPIYYVNDRPHIGHLYTTTVADVVARHQRLCGRDVFFLTGTDEHAAKVVDAAAANGMSVQDWADRNADAFKQTFEQFQTSHDDFIRTSEQRHKSRVSRYVSELLESGDVYSGQYEGWYDAGQEEYVSESKAKEFDYKSPINGRPLVRKQETNYFFRLTRYGDTLLRWLEDNPAAVSPESRRNEVIGRITEGLNDVPISRTGAGGWGIQVPGDPQQTIYVWIDALFNYLSTVDDDERRGWWPANIHLIGKDILWFHAVIWPAILSALSRRPGFEWVSPPAGVYAHSFWISEGQKMSKSLGNFIDLEKLQSYRDRFGLDALRYYLATQGPMHSDDADFAESRFIDVYNAHLANTLGNCVSRILNMCGRYFDGKLPHADASVEAPDEHAALAESCVGRVREAFASLHLDQAAAVALDLVRHVDGYIERTQPFKLAKDPANLPRVGTILHHSAQMLRIASLCLWPFMPGKCAEICRRFGDAACAEALGERTRGRFGDWTKWGLLQGGTALVQGDALFPRSK